MTIIFEQRQVNDKVLVVQFQFDTYDIKVNGSHVDGMSFDKYIGLDVWTQIYTKLEEPLERYRINTDIRLKEEYIQMRRAQLELRVSWRSKQAFHREIANQEGKKCSNSLCPYVMVVKIGMVSYLDKFKKQHSQDKLTGEKTSQSQKSTVRESDGSNDTRTSNGSSTGDVEEYVPTGTPANSLKYTPSIVSSGTEKSTKSDEYSPTQSTDDVVTYTPTKINEIKSHRDQSNKHKSIIKTDVNRNDYPSKKKRTDNTPKINDLLFGGDSDDSSGRQNHNLRSAKKANPVELSKEKPQPKIDTWITKTRPTKKNFLENGVASDDIQKKRKINEISPIELVPCNKQATKDEESRKLRALREELEQMEDKRVTIDNIINLKDVPIAELTDTFPDFETSLRRKFRSYANVPDQRIEPSKDECDYLLILDGLVEQEQQKKMYRKLRAEFCESDRADAIASSHENLIWKCLLPEWALRIFMDRHFLEKEAAMERLRQQDQAQFDDNSFDC